MQTRAVCSTNIAMEDLARKHIVILMEAISCLSRAQDNLNASLSTLQKSIDQQEAYTMKNREFVVVPYRKTSSRCLICHPTLAF
jgi:hypothetical protein